MQRITVSPGATLPSYTHSVDALYMVRCGSMTIGGRDDYQTEDWRWVKAGQTTTDLTAGADGADIITVGVGGIAAFDWA